MQSEINFTTARFAGADYDHERDHARLGAQLQRIFDVMKDGEWRTLDDIEAATGDPQASISAQLRFLRRPRFGAHTVEKEYVENGLYRYRVILKGSPTGGAD